MKLYYKESGDLTAPLLVFLHGGGVSGWMWYKQMEYFTNYHCLVPDLPGHGKSNNGMKFTIQDSAKEIIRIIEDKAGDKQVILIGFSLGSQVIIQMLSMKPDLADITILNSAAVRPMVTAKKWIKPAIKFTYPLIKYKWFSKLQARTLYIGDEYVETYYQESMSIREDTLVRVLEENMSFSLPNNFQNVSGRILVTVGEKEKNLMKESARDIVNSNANAVGVILPGIGHGAPMGTPDFFNGLLDKWLSSAQLHEEYNIIKSATESNYY